MPVHAGFKVLKGYFKISLFAVFEFLHHTCSEIVKKTMLLGGAFSCHLISSINKITSYQYFSFSPTFVSYTVVS